jgi:hypothetical protein
MATIMHMVGVLIVCYVAVTVGIYLSWIRKIINRKGGENE